MRSLRVGSFLLIVSAACAALMALTAVGQADAQQAPSDRVTVVMTEMAPFVLNDDGNAEGFYAEIWDEVAQSLNVEYDVIWVDSFSDLLPTIGDGRADVAIAPLAPTAEQVQPSTRRVGHR